MKTLDKQDISFFPVPTPTIPIQPNSGDSGAQGKLLNETLKRVAADAPPDSSVFTASACGADHHVHVYYGVHDAVTKTSILLGDIRTEVLC